MVSGSSSSTSNGNAPIKEINLEKDSGNGKIRDNARQMAYTTGTSGQHKGLSHVWGPTQHNPSKCQSSKTKGDLEIMCLEEAGQRFTQAGHTPFLKPPLVEIFMEYNVHTPAFKQVLQGTFVCPIGTNPMTQQLIKALAQPPGINTIQQQGIDEITAGWRKAHKVTSSSPLGVHFGHYMAGTFNPTIAVFNARLANLGFTMGYSLKRWRKGLNMLLEKQPGNLNVEKLCIILLFEGDFNNNNKWPG